MLDLNQSDEDTLRSVGSIAVSDSRIFFQSNLYDRDEFRYLDSQ
jgi:hypothetical protein